MFIYDHIWWYVGTYAHTQSYVIIYDHMWSYRIMCDHMWSYMIMYDHICSYIIIYDQTWSYTICMISYSGHPPCHLPPSRSPPQVTMLTLKINEQFYWTSPFCFAVRGIYFLPVSWKTWVASLQCWVQTHPKRLSIVYSRGLTNSERLA